MGLDSLLAQHAHHAYGHSHHSQHEVHPLDDILGSSPEPHVHFVYVGHNKGRYVERTKGCFDYVGCHKGDYEKELLPQDHTCRYIGICLCLVIAALLLIALIHALLEDPPFDCHEGELHWERGWSTLKKEWCCENEGIACPYTVGEVTTTQNPAFTTPPPPVVPLWLEKWLADMNIGAKFIMTMSMALITGCAIGAFMFYIMVRYCITPKKSKTELELMAEVNELLAKNGVHGRGELNVTLMWDTKEDLDLHLLLPGGGEISALCPENKGGRLDVDANGNPLKSTKFPIENISWPMYDPSNPANNPPEGVYEIWAKSGRHVLHCDANLTVVKTVHGRREIFHHRMVPGTFEKKITTFEYRKPSGR